MTGTKDIPRDRLGRRGLICLAMLLAAVLVSASVAAAAPTATLKVKPLSIPGFPGTGDFLGAGFDVETQVTISGTEYGGFPSPLTGINFYTPIGVKITPTGFATCSATLLEASGPEKCPKNSSAGPVGIGLGVVAFGNEEVREQVSIQSFFAESGLVFYVEGSTPVPLQFVERAHYVNAAPPFGKELIIEVPLVETVPGALNASVTAFKVRVGAAYKKGKRTISYITQPKRCPKAGLPVKMELKFLSGETTTVEEKVPCPKK
jgi:hypothetical protein